jgi:glutamyl-tRNA reductase
VATLRKALRRGWTESRTSGDASSSSRERVEWVRRWLTLWPPPVRLIRVASRDQTRASRLASIYGGQGVSLEVGAALSSKAAAVAVALAGKWVELAAVAGQYLPPIADISAPQAVPDSVRRQLNGSFLGIDDLYRRSQTLPGAYMKDAEALVERNSAEYVAWLGPREQRFRLLDEPRSDAGCH